MNTSSSTVADLREKVANHQGRLSKAKEDLSALLSPLGAKVVTGAQISKAEAEVKAQEVNIARQQMLLRAALAAEPRLPYVATAVAEALEPHGIPVMVASSLDPKSLPVLPHWVVVPYGNQPVRDVVEGVVKGDVDLHYVGTRLHAEPSLEKVSTALQGGQVTLSTRPHNRGTRESEGFNITTFRLMQASGFEPTPVLMPERASAIERVGQSIGHLLQGEIGSTPRKPEFKGRSTVTNGEGATHLQFSAVYAMHPERWYDDDLFFAALPEIVERQVGKCLHGAGRISRASDIEVLPYSEHTGMTLGMITVAPHARVSATFTLSWRVPTE